MSTSPTNSTTPTTSTQKPESRSLTAKVELSDIERFIKEFIDRLVIQKNDYSLELEAIGWNSVLDVKRIKNDSALSESRVITERAKGIVEKYEKKTAELLQNTREHLESLNILEKTKKDMLAGFDSAMRKGGKQLDEQWNLEKQIVRQVENIFFMLGASKKWIVQGEQIVFYDDSELVRYNSYIKTIQDLAQQEEQLQRKSLAQANKNMETLKNELQR